MADAIPPTPLLTVERVRHGAVDVIGLTGELDLGTVAEVEAALAEVAGPEPRVCLDITALEFIDSTGLAAVIRAHTAAVAAGGRFVVACSEGHVRRTFETTGLVGMLVLSSSRTSALRDLSA